MGDLVKTRLTPEVRAAASQWAEQHPDVDRRDGRPVEADAIRVMVERVLAEDGVLRTADGDTPTAAG